jgi:hypothetical protein
MYPVDGCVPLYTAQGALVSLSFGDPEPPQQPEPAASAAEDRRSPGSRPEVAAGDDDKF